MTPHKPRGEVHAPHSPWDPKLYRSTFELRRTREPIAPGVRFCLVDGIGLYARKVAYASARDLAAALHRRRRGQALQLEDQRLVCGHCSADVVAVYTTDESGYRSGFLAYAWLNGAGWRALQAELYALDPNPAPRAEAYA